MACKCRPAAAVANAHVEITDEKGFCNEWARFRSVRKATGLVTTPSSTAAWLGRAAPGGGGSKPVCCVGCVDSVLL